MSVWPEPLPSGPSLSGTEGTLVAVSIETEPRNLEALLEVLADLDFPVNPEIYHDAAVLYVFPDGREEVKPVTLVAFPAYESRLPAIRRGIECGGFDPACVSAAGMLDAIHAERIPEPPPQGAHYVARYRLRRRTAAALN
jgi:hypothetical protein